MRTWEQRHLGSSPPWAAPGPGQLAWSTGSPAPALRSARGFVAVCSDLSLGREREDPGMPDTDTGHIFAATRTRPSCW